MKVLKCSIIAKVIIKKHKRNFEIRFSVIKNVKNVKRQYFSIIQNATQSLIQESSIYCRPFFHDYNPAI